MYTEVPTLSQNVHMRDQLFFPDQGFLALPIAPIPKPRQWAQMEVRVAITANFALPSSRHRNEWLAAHVTRATRRRRPCTEGKTSTEGHFVFTLFPHGNTCEVNLGLELFAMDPSVGAGAIGARARCFAHPQPIRMRLEHRYANATRAKSPRPLARVSRDGAHQRNICLVRCAAGEEDNLKSCGIDPVRKALLARS